MSTPAPPPFDPTPLTEPVDRAAAREWAKRNDPPVARSGSQIAGIVIAAVIFLVVAGTMIPVFVIMLIDMFSRRDETEGTLGLMLPLLTFVALAVFAVYWLIRGRADARERRYRLHQFASINDMTYRPRIENPPLPGMIFGRGSSRAANDAVRREHPRFVEFANYRYTTGSGKNETTHRWGYVAVRLDVPLPHIVLDAKSNNGLFGSNLPTALDKSQRLELEGDFNRHFTLYCPEGYERDALYLFTPDIMARFIDDAAALDVEIIDDWLFFYAKRDFVTLDPATWTWLFSVVGAVTEKLAQWARWRDEKLRVDATPTAAGIGPLIPGLTRAAEQAAPLPVVGGDPLRPPPGVAESGRRLARGIPWRPILILGGVAVVWAFMQFGVFGR